MLARVFGLDLVALANIAALTKRPKVVRLCLSATGNGPDVIHMQHTPDLRRRTCTTQNTPEAIPAQHIIARAQGNGPDIPSRLRRVIFQPQGRPPLLLSAFRGSILIHPFDECDECLLPGAPLFLIRARRNLRWGAIHFTIIRLASTEGPDCQQVFKVIIVRVSASVTRKMQPCLLKRRLPRAEAGDHGSCVDARCCVESFLR